MRKAWTAVVAGALLLQSAVAVAAPSVSVGANTGNAVVGRINNRMSLGLATAQPPAACAPGENCAPGKGNAGDMAAGSASHFPVIPVVLGIAAVGGIVALAASGKSGGTSGGNPTSP